MRHFKQLYITLALFCGFAGTTGTASAWSDTEEDGTQQHPYVISSLTDWSTFVTFLKNNSYGDGRYFSLGADIDGVTGIARFYGTLYGNGHKLTLGKADRFIAQTVGAHIHDLHLTGNLDGDYLFSYLMGTTLSGCYFECGSSNPNGQPLRLVTQPNVGAAATVENCIFALNGSAPGFVRSGTAITDPTPAYTLTLTGATTQRTDGTPILGGTATVYDDGFRLDGTDYYTSGATVTLIDNAPTGYHATYTGTVTPDADNQFTMPGHDFALTVNVNAPNTYTVHFNANGGTSEMADQAFTYDVSQALTANAYIAPTGYTFAEWNTIVVPNNDNPGTPYTDGQSVSNLTAINGDVVTLYAQWTPITYTVRMYRNHDSNDETYTDQTFTYNVEQTLTANDFTPPSGDYTFAGWNTASDGTGTPYTNPQEVSNLAATQRAIVTLHAHWTQTVHLPAIAPPAPGMVEANAGNEVPSTIAMRTVRRKSLTPSFPPKATT